MSKLNTLLKVLMPVIAAAYGLGIVFVTALSNVDEQPVLSEMLSWPLTLACIGLTYFLVKRPERKLFPSASQFSLKVPSARVLTGVLRMAPLWCVAEEYIVYGLASLTRTVQLDQLTYSTPELREDLLASVHAVLLAPVLEELCFRQMGISPFRRRWVQVVVCVVMALFFGIFHVRNFIGSFFGAIVYGLAFVFTRNVWYSIALHAGHNLTATLMAVYCWMGLGEIQVGKLPVIMLSDTKFLIASLVLTAVGLWLVKREKR